ncbi:hypothetical protein B0H19DRAFT_1083877 [Mycena capillaripes]|nr:hypothetical protein B0H19DRAFT_1083877 [Mycena capillaripes]
MIVLNHEYGQSKSITCKLGRVGAAWQRIARPVPLWDKDAGTTGYGEVQSGEEGAAAPKLNATETSDKEISPRIMGRGVGREFSKRPGFTLMGTRPRRMVHSREGQEFNGCYNTSDSTAKRATEQQPEVMPDPRKSLAELHFQFGKERNGQRMTILNGWEELLYIEHLRQECVGRRDEIE